LTPFLDSEWKDGCLAAATLTSRLGREARLRYAEKTESILIPAGGRYTWQPGACRAGADLRGDRN